MTIMASAPVPGAIKLSEISTVAFSPAPAAVPCPDWCDGDGCGPYPKDPGQLHEMTIAEVVGTDAASTDAKTTARVWLERFDDETPGTTEIVLTLEDPEPVQIAYSGSERRTKSLRLPNAEAAEELAAALLKASGHAGGHDTDANSYTAGYVAGLRHAWGLDRSHQAAGIRQARSIDVAGTGAGH